MALWLINCEEYSRLSSQALDRPLSFWQRMHIRIHQWLCPPCSCVNQQFETIRKACRHSSHEIDLPAEVQNAVLSEDTCLLLKTEVQKNIHKSKRLQTCEKKSLS